MAESVLDVVSQLLTTLTPNRAPGRLFLHKIIKYNINLLELQALRAYVCEKLLELLDLCARACFCMFLHLLPEEASRAGSFCKNKLKL